MQNLTRLEYQELQEALLGAFKPESLEQIVMFTFGINLDTIVIGGNSRKIVYELIRWTEAENKTEELIAGARKENPTNHRLRTFEQNYLSARQGTKIAIVSHPHLPSDLRSNLIENLVSIYTNHPYQSRSGLLGGIPETHLLTRSETNLYDDIVGVIDQLDQRGQLDSNQWPLLILIDNALKQVGEYRVQDKLQATREKLVQLYNE